MARFLIRSLVSTAITLFLVSLLIEVGGGDIAQKILGIFSTPEQRASFRAQVGLDAPVWQRYLDWLIESDWRAESHLAHPPSENDAQSRGRRGRMVGGFGGGARLVVFHAMRNALLEVLSEFEPVLNVGKAAHSRYDVQI